VAGSAAFDEIQDCLGELADPVRAEHSKGFFKTGPGEYGEGDVFLGLKVPDMRKVARRFHNLTLADVRRLLRSPLHEYRLTALFILVRQFKKADERGRTRIYDLYLKNTRYVNNWDLVNSSAHQIVGGYLADKDFGILLQLVKSSSLWERRIAIIATYHLIKCDDFTWTIRIAKHLVADDEYLIHKAVGWMLREVGNRDRAAEERFLAKHYQRMPRTMLRYAIERFPERRRQAYLKGRV